MYLDSYKGSPSENRKDFTNTDDMDVTTDPQHQDGQQQQERDSKKFPDKRDSTIDEQRIYFNRNPASNLSTINSVKSKSVDNVRVRFAEFDDPRSRVRRSQSLIPNDQRRISRRDNGAYHSACSNNGGSERMERRRKSLYRLPATNVENAHANESTHRLSIPNSLLQVKDQNPSFDI